MVHVVIVAGLVVVRLVTGGRQGRGPPAAARAVVRGGLGVQGGVQEQHVGVAVTVAGSGGGLGGGVLAGVELS